MKSQTRTRTWGIYQVNPNNPTAPRLRAVVETSNKESAQAEAERLGFHEARVRPVTRAAINEAEWQSHPRPRTRDHSIHPDAIEEAIRILKHLHNHIDRQDIEKTRGNSNLDSHARARQLAESRVIERLGAIDDSIHELRKWREEMATREHIHASHGHSV